MCLHGTEARFPSEADVFLCVNMGGMHAGEKAKQSKRTLSLDQAW